jgi:hypothetical protein
LVGRPLAGTRGTNAAGSNASLAGPCRAASCSERGSERGSALAALAPAAGATSGAGMGAGMGGVVGRPAKVRRSENGNM